MSGLPQDDVRVEPHDPEWPRLFEREASALREALGPLALQIEHIGSTAVPGLDAKPIVDIAIKTGTLAVLPQIIAAMANHAYAHRGEFGLPGRQFFTKGNPVRVHAHVVQEDSPHWPRWIGFRDLLRADGEMRCEYTALKRELVARFPHNRPAYTAAKSDFIARAIAKG